MAETLTFDNTTEQTSADNLTAEEQDSLQVGEQIQEQENQLLAGKYENAQELEKAYIELQKKMGSSDKQEGEEGEASEETEEKSDEPEMEVTPTMETLTKAALEFEEKGELSAETMDAFKQMSSQEVVDTYTKMYSEALKKGFQADGQATEDLTDGEVNSIRNSVGGDAAYENMLTWATNNLPESTMKSFDALVESGNAASIQLAVDGLKAQFENANGYEGRMLSGKAPQTSGDVYRSQQEVIRAMSDPRYDDDPAFRQDVIDKLARSNVEF
tara:strand:+ start:573 stop:1388 length:816 start_codon:yes stop_codon:yes gene_type:complete